MVLGEATAADLRLFPAFWIIVDPSLWDNLRISWIELRRFLLVVTPKVHEGTHEFLLFALMFLVRVVMFFMGGLLVDEDDAKLLPLVQARCPVVEEGTGIIQRHFFLARIANEKFWVTVVKLRA
jgi:hypothetical protein